MASYTDLAVKLRPGVRVRFAKEKQTYTVRAVTDDGRYASCTKTFNARRTSIALDIVALGER